MNGSNKKVPGANKLTAITRNVSDEIRRCALTFFDRKPIDSSLATAQHQHYKQSLTELGVQVIALPALPDFPDGVFVEDTAVVADEIAVITTMGVSSRKGEQETVAARLADFRTIVRLEPPAALEGGDVMRIGRTLYAGLSTRTNKEAVYSLQRILAPYDYKIVPVAMDNCLHLKTGCTFVGRNSILINTDCISAKEFHDFELIELPKEEPWAGNSLLIKDTLLYSSAFPRTQQLLEKKGIQVKTIDIGELQKAEAGLTCMSIIF